MKKVLCLIVGILCMMSSAHAGTSSWSNSDYSMGSYVPVSGSFSENWCCGGQYVSTTSFTLSSSNVSSIGTYNNGYGTGGSCSGYNSYLTIDMTAAPNASDLEIDANAIYSNLPNAHYDIETDWPFTPDHEESETVALGSLNAQNYYMTTYWIDERDGGAGDGGNIQVQFAMSKLGWSDYNNCVTSNSVQIINPYGNGYGSY